MVRKIVCRVCDSERFRAVLVSLPSGAVRVTDLDYCLGCSTVVYRPDERELSPEERRDGGNVSSFNAYIPSEVSRQIAASFPDANTALVDMQSAHYRHPTFGRLVLFYKRQETVGTSEKGMKWALVDAKRFAE